MRTAGRHPILFVASVLAISLLAVVMIPLERPVHAQQQNFNPAQSSSGPPFVATGNGTVNATVAMTQNNIACWGFVDNATGPFTSSTLTYVVNVADNTANSYDLGLYDASGNRIAHTGVLAGTSLFAGTGIASVAWAGSVNLTPGQKYYFAATSSAASPAAKFSGSITPNFMQSASACGTSTAALLPTTITVPADSWAIGTAPPSLIFR
jgi:hypothetical protein